jgi:hypothetical protein
MKKFLIILLFNLTIQLGYSYPITPQTLRKQIENSDYIVIGKISNPPTEIESYQFDSVCNCNKKILLTRLYGDGVADLSILKTLKGELTHDSISVIYPNNISNPRPPKYPDGKIVIAFLRKSDSIGFFETVGLSYGTIIFDSLNETNEYELRIQEYINILKIKNERKRKTETASWLVRCCLSKETRWHGSYELSKNRHWISYYDKSKDEKFKRYLSPSEILILENIVLTSDTIGYNELCLSDFVRKKNNYRLQNILLNNIEYHRILFSQALMERYIQIDKNQELKLLLKNYESLELTKKDKENEAIAISTQFVEKARKRINSP